MKKDTSAINESLKQIWDKEDFEPIQKQEKQPVILPPQHIVNYHQNKESKPETVSYKEAQKLLGFTNDSSVSVMVCRGKITKKDGKITTESIENYKNTKLSQGIQGIREKRDLMLLSKKDHEVTYDEAKEMLNCKLNTIYNLISAQKIKGKDGFCDRNSVIEYAKTKSGRGRKAGTIMKKRINPFTQVIDSFFDGLNVEENCLPPEKIVVPTLEDVKKALNENVVGDSYKHLKIDTVEWSKANHTKEQQKAICQFMINKYTMRQKNQDKDDIKKARFYLDWLEETI